MERNLKQLLLDYYQIQQCENAIRREFEKMGDSPVIYNNGTDMDHLQEVLDYETELEKLQYDIDSFYQSGRVIAQNIADALELIGVPYETKITISYGGLTNLNFWHDEYDVYYQLAV